MSKYIKLIGLLLAAYGFCFAQQTPLKIQFKPTFNKEKLTLFTSKYVTNENDTVSIERLKFYISNIELKLDNQIVFKEKESYHLIDMEEEKLGFNLEIPSDIKFNFLSFDIGVDSLKSTSGAQGGELDPVKGMYWAWNTGYIYAKLEGKSKSCKTRNNVFEFHIGGFIKPNNAIKKVTIPVVVSNNNISIEVLTEKWFQNVKLTELNSVVIPGKEALKIANNYAEMFK